MTLFTARPPSDCGVKIFLGNYFSDRSTLFLAGAQPGFGPVREGGWVTVAVGLIIMALFLPIIRILTVEEAAGCLPGIRGAAAVGDR